MLCNVCFQASNICLIVFFWHSHGVTGVHLSYDKLWFCHSRMKFKKTSSGKSCDLLRNRAEIPQYLIVTELTGFLLNGSISRLQS